MRADTPYQARCARLERCAPPRAEWRARSCGDVAATLKALGVSAQGVRRVLGQMAVCTEHEQPAALSDLCDGFRIGVAHVEAVARFNGRPIGVCGRFAVLVWPKRESEMAAQR